MNTMADGAAQRLVAQIGEALFGQPGLTLMELAEKVKGMRAPSLIEEEPLPADMRIGSADYLDYLDAQPSPAGQGVQFPWENFPAYLIDNCEGDTISEEGLQQALAAMAKDERYCIAARQPVRIYGCCAQPEGELHTDDCPNLRHLAARQPVGQEPVTVEAVATVRRNSDGDRYIDWLTEGGIADLEAGDVLMVSDRRITDESGSGEVYAAPPAQAVDLAQLARYESVGSDGMNMERIADGRWVKLDDVLALIDSKVVGNGTDR